LSRNEPGPVSDPRRIRALAHPVRLALLEVLVLAGPLTATQAGERIGESPTTCSFHLRQLAKYGFVEEAGAGPGRNRPWRVVSLGLTATDVGGGAESAIALQALEGLLVDRWMGRIQHWMRTRHSYPREWQDAAGITQSLLYVTPDELREVLAELMPLLMRHAERFRDRAQRPAGALPVEVVAFAYPLAPHPEV